ncbi:MAG: CotH kinase family protein, partial [Ruminococcus sp.]|nr:CotH kinase family protein [Ruminococcus sp.]
GDQHVGGEIDVTGLDFDTAKLMLWTDINTQKPCDNAVVLSYDDVIAAPSRAAVEPRYGDIPNVYLTGDMTGISKDNKVTLQMKYESGTETIDGYVSAKWQGNYALKFEKKNFAIKLYKDEALSKKKKVSFKDWDKSNNYVLKANYIDATGARNIVNARLYSTLPDTYLQNGAQGVVDGFPVRLYINGEFFGLYTWNKPKKGWVFGMDGDNPDELLYFSNYALKSGLFLNKYSKDKYWELVYPDEHEDVSEFDRVTGFVAECTDEEFKEHIGEYIDLNSLLNYYVFSQIILHTDGLGKNLNMATYDGNIWYIRPYDMDATYGLYWTGKVTVDYDTDMTEDLRKSRLWSKLEDNFAHEIYERYILLRNGQLSEDRIIAAFEYFMDEVGSDLYQENIEKWPSTPGSGFMLDQIKDYIKARYEFLDVFMEKFNH